MDNVFNAPTATVNAQEAFDYSFGPQVHSCRLIVSMAAAAHSTSPDHQASRDFAATGTISARIARAFNFAHTPNFEPVPEGAAHNQENLQ